jgi:exonuclease V gamma subunit
MMRKTGGRTYMPTVLSKNGRIIFVKGGITPDIVEKNDTINVLTRVLIQKGIFLEFVYNFLYSEKEMLLQKYKADFKKFNRDYVIEDSFLDDFKKYSMKRNIWNEDYYQKDKEYFRDYLKALISYTLWGENGYRSVIFKRDRIINTALSTIPEYEKILKINN